MRAGACVVVGVLSVAAPARAGVEEELTPPIKGLIGSDAHGVPAFAFTFEHVDALGDKNRVAPTFRGDELELDELVVAASADGKTGWVAADIESVVLPGCAPEPCTGKRTGPFHVTGLLEKQAGGWRWIAWHLAKPVPAKAQAALLEKRVVPDVLATVTTGADDVAKLFTTSIADPKTFAATVSDRTDVVLLGSELTDRVVGGAKVQAKLLAWNLAFKVRDGVQAGVSGSKNVAWVAANVDAASAKKQRKASPYRVLAIYEKPGTAWKLVQVQFSVDPK